MTSITCSPPEKRLAPCNQTGVAVVFGLVLFLVATSVHLTWFTSFSIHFEIIRSSVNHQRDENFVITKGSVNHQRYPSNSQDISIREESERNNTVPAPTPAATIAPRNTFLRQATTPRTLPHVGICAIMANGSSPYLQEWIDYHLLAVEFDFIHIYDNSANYSLQKFESDRVQVQHWPGNMQQIKAYTDCARNHNGTADFLAFLDDDEFLVLHNHSSVGAFLRDHCTEDCGSISLHWQIFGTSNHTAYAPSVPVTYRFQLRENQTDHRVKSIVRVPDFVSFKSPHGIQTQPGTFQINTLGRKDGFSDQTGATNRNPVSNVAVIHHYKYKSIQEYRTKSCDRKTVTGYFKGCGEDMPVGDVQDDAAWQTLIQKVPKYRYAEKQPRSDSLVSHWLDWMMPL